jgi:phospholipase/carboxylesterase
MVDQPSSIKINNWTLRVRIPDSPAPHPVLLMLHGWTGDEKVMWIFTDRFPKEYLILSPRGLFDTPLGGYAWHTEKSRRWPAIDDFLKAIDALNQLLIPENFPTGDLSSISLAGFSQGAALAYAYALLNPQRVDRIMGLAGFLPTDVDEIIADKPLIGKSIFIAHGTKDELVPVWRARQSVEYLTRAGAQVTYCEDDVGHKLSVGCFRGLESFFEL